MKTRTIIAIALCSIIFTDCYAQKSQKKGAKAEASAETAVAEPEQTEAEPVTTEECLINLSLFNESAKNKQYADAVTPWLAVYNDCPSANKAIYTQGRNILHWQLSQTTDEATRNELRNRLMEMYDKRMKYFGKDPKYPTAYILGLKGLDYITFFPEDELKEPAYKWLEQSVDGLKGNAEVEVLRQFVVLSSNKYKANQEHAEKYIADYLKAAQYLDEISKNPTDKSAELAGQVKLGLDGLFVQSGVADCNTLDNIYRNKLKENASNLDYLNQIIIFYKRTGCTSSEVYFSAAENAHKISPTEGSANGCAEMCYKKEEYAQAVKYYEEATKLAENDDDKAEYQYKIALIYYSSSIRNYSTARSYARKSLEFNPNQGRCYILIGSMYASSKPYDDAVLNKTVFWVAVDEFIKAKRVDPSCTAEVDEKIATYSRYYPTKEEIFFQPDLSSGKSFCVGGWIGECTTCR